MGSSILGCETALQVVVNSFLFAGTVAHEIRRKMNSKSKANFLKKESTPLNMLLSTFAFCF